VDYCIVSHAAIHEKLLNATDWIEKGLRCNLFFSVLLNLLMKVHQIEKKFSKGETELLWPRQDFLPSLKVDLLGFKCLVVRALFHLLDLEYKR
jgi:hypothetical protein